MKKTGIFISMVICAINISVYTLLYFDNKKNIEIYGMVCIFLLLLLPLIIAEIKKTWDIFNPLVITNIAYFLYFAYTPFSDMLTNKLTYDGVYIKPFIAKGNLYVILGIIAMYMGYNSYLIKRLKIKKLKFRININATKKICYIFYCLTLCCFSIYIKLVGSSWIKFITLGRINTNLDVNIFNNDSPLTFYMSDTIYFSIVIYLLLIYITKQRVRITLLFLPIILATITLGFRYMIIIILGAPLIYYYLKNKKRPKNMQIIIFVLLAFLVVGAVGGTRTDFRTGGKINNDAFSFESMYNAFMINNDIYHPFYGMIHNIPAHHDYFYGSSFAYIFISPLPRALWPAKPEPPVKAILYYSLYSYEAVASGRAFPNIGEFYANFGIFGIAIGMYVFGAIQKILYRYYKANQENAYVLIAYSIIWPFLLQYISRGYFVQIFTAFVFIFLPLWVVCIFNKRCKIYDIK